MIRRYLTGAVVESLSHFPVVLLTGARQVGKSTLAQSLISSLWPARYVTLDDRNVLDAALRDPDGFIAGQKDPVIIDEVQRAPDLLRAIKLSVDRDRTPGRFLLTGSANLLTLSTVSETLAGRVGLHSLLPFSWAEKKGRPRNPIFERLLAARTASEAAALFPPSHRRDRKQEIIEDILAGGFFPAAMAPTERARREWFASYRQTYLERDLLNIKAIEHLPDFNRLLTLSSLRTGRLVNQSDLARDSGLAFSTLRRYMNLLDVTYQVYFLPPYHVHIGKRLVKTPKLFFQDTGMAAYFAGLDDWATMEKQGFAGPFVETWAASEIRKAISLEDRRLNLYFWRTQTGQEVDFLIERAGKIVAIEVKWGGRIEDSAVRNLARCLDDLGGGASLGVVLYGGSEILVLNPKIFAVPFGAFFGAG